MARLRRRVEDSLQMVVARFLEEALPDDAVWTAIGHGIRVSIGLAVRLKRMGLRAGFPDLLVLWRGRLILIELKSKTGGRSKAQQELHPRLVAAGAHVVTARRVETVAAALIDQGVPLRPAALARWQRSAAWSMAA